MHRPWPGAESPRSSPAGVRLLAVLVAVAGPAIAACGGETSDGTRSAAAAGQDSAAPAASVDRSPAGLRTTTITVGGHEVTVEVAESDAERKRGLMGRDSLPEDHGMLFVYSRPQTLSFWMRNTSIPLSIAYVARDGRIVDIQRMEPHTQEQHPSREPAMYALEMNRGWFEEHGVTVGDRIQF